MSGFTLISCIVNMGDSAKVLRAAKPYGIKGATIAHAKGTAHIRLLEVLMINEVRKEIVTMVMETERASEAMKGISAQMEFEKPHHGIAFSHAVGECIGGGCTPASGNKDEVMNSMYKAIYVIVDKGMAEDVIESANRAGARGGTVMNARSSGIHEAQKLFSIEIQPEKEQIMIIVASDIKDNVIGALQSDLNIGKEGNGIIFVMDVNAVYGLHMGGQQNG